MTAIAVHGAGGRMGKSVLDVLSADVQARVAGAIEREGHAVVGQDAGVIAGRPGPIGCAVSAELDAGLAGAEVVIDFSEPRATERLLAHCVARKLPAVVGTTGLDKAAGAALERLAEVAPVVYAPNFSVGVNVLWDLCARAAYLLGEDYDLEIVELHHRHKVDAPSGTAVELLRVVADARGLDPEWASVSDRGARGKRSKGEVGIHSLRGGEAVGEHTLVLAGPGEVLELTHRAQSRDIFARGAVRAAHWVVGKPPALYGMADVLGLNEG